MASTPLRRPRSAKHHVLPRRSLSPRCCRSCLHSRTPTGSLFSGGCSAFYSSARRRDGSIGTTFRWLPLRSEAEMDVYIRGGGSVSLSQADFVAQGGEGSVYVKGSLAYKIYSDPQKMIPAAKLQELSALTAPNIIKPQDVLLNSRHTPVGYTMKRVQD